MRINVVRVVAWSKGFGFSTTPHTQGRRFCPKVLSDGGLEKAETKNDEAVPSGIVYHVGSIQSTKT